MFFGCCREQAAAEKAGEGEGVEIAAITDEQSPIKGSPVGGKSPISPVASFCCREEVADGGAGEGEGVEIANDYQSPIATPKAVKAAPKTAPVKRISNNRSSSKELGRSASKEMGRSASKESAPDPSKKSNILQKKGDEAFELKNWEEATKLYSEAIVVYPQNAAAYAGRAGVRVRQGDYPGAMRDLDEALKIEPQNLYALRDRAEARAKMGDLDGALADYNAKIQLAPGDGRALCGRGEIKLKKGDKEGAISDINFAVRLAYPGAQKLLKETQQKITDAGGKGKKS